MLKQAIILFWDGNLNYIFLTDLKAKYVLLIFFLEFPLICRKQNGRKQGKQILTFTTCK